MQLIDAVAGSSIRSLMQKSSQHIHPPMTMHPKMFDMLALDPNSMSPTRSRSQSFRTDSPTPQ